MQSQFGKAQTGRQRRAGRAGAATCGISPGCAAQLASSVRCSVQSNGGCCGRGRSLRYIFRLCGSACEQFALLGPVQRQIEFGQTRRGGRDGLPALQDRVDQLRAQERETNKPADVASGDTVTLGVVSERPCADERRLQPNERLCVSRSTSALPDLPRSGPPAG